MSEPKKNELIKALKSNEVFFEQIICYFLIEISFLAQIMSKLSFLENGFGNLYLFGNS
jgi:hypothetical protein